MSKIKVKHVAPPENIVEALDDVTDAKPNLPIDEITEALSKLDAEISIPTITDHLEAAIAMLAPMAKSNNPCLEQAHSLLVKHVVHLVRTGLKQ
jgi:hypothetical protein